MRAPFCIASHVVAIVLAASVSRAQGVDARSGETGSPTRGPRATPDDAAAPTLPWHGSVLLFDQSVTTQTVGVGKDFQTRDALYEWWFAFKPRYYLVESAQETLSLHLWMNLYLEFTDSDTTTTRREPVIGPTTAWASYARTIIERGGHRTQLHGGPRMTLPTDRASRSAGQILALGASAGVRQQLALRDPETPSFATGRLELTAIYMHPFQRATSPVSGDLEQPRQDVAGRSVLSDQLRGNMNTANSLSVIFSGGVQILPKLGLTLSYVAINEWAYAPKDAAICTAMPDCATPKASDPTSYRVKTWGLASLDYDILDEMSLSLGYYNLTSQIGADGQRRNPLWSPDARFFLTVTGNLDVMYQRLRPQRPPTAVGRLSL